MQVHVGLLAVSLDLFIARMEMILYLFKANSAIPFTTLLYHLLWYKTFQYPLEYSRKFMATEKPKRKPRFFLVFQGPLCEPPF